MSECNPYANAGLRPPRVLLAIESLDGGSGRHVVDLAEELARRGRDVTVAYSPLRANASFVERLESNPNIATARFNMRRAVHPSDALALFELWRIVKRLGPFDIVHGHSSKAGAAVRLLPAGRARKVYTPHAFRTMDPKVPGPLSAFYAAMERGLAGLTDAIICGSLFERQHAEELDVRPRTVRLIANGALPPSDDRRAELRAAAGLGEDDICIGTVGRFAPQKNPDRLVAALAKALAAEPRAKAVIVGGGAMRDHVHELIETHGIADRVHVVENQPGEPWMRAFDLFVVSSDYEAMPYVYIEALFAGLPIVSTWVGGTDETVENGENGFIVRVGEDEAFAEKIIEVTRDAALRERFAAASARKSAGFHLSVMTDKVEALYADLLQERADQPAKSAGAGEEEAGSDDHDARLKA
ncbi:MAG: glycosyltransferase family 4 protein [Maricaulaceae bacterium]|jgi:glycosyltransferase involved in cell wall biosynthesis